MPLNKLAYRLPVKLAGLLFVTLLLSSCAVGRATNPQDPFETLNRKTFAFNQKVDRIVYRPIANLYNTITPDFIDRGVTNFFQNLGQVGTIGNDILQADLEFTLLDTARLFINTTVGVLGLFDPASHIGLPLHYQDFGLTLAKWGVKNSPYFVVPFLGPSTLRDTAGLPPDYYMSPLTYVKPDSACYGLVALDRIDRRADLLSADKLLTQAFDPYVFLRNAYLQKRKQRIRKIGFVEKSMLKSETQK